MRAREGQYREPTGILVFDTTDQACSVVVAEALGLRFPNIDFVSVMRGGSFQVRTTTATIGHATLQRVHEAASAAVCTYRSSSWGKGSLMITGFLVKCPACGAVTNMPARIWKDTTPLRALPVVEIGECSGCDKTLAVKLDLHVVGVEVVVPNG